MRFAFRGLDDYEQWVIDVTGPFAIVVRGLPEDERGVLRARLREAFAPFAMTVATSFRASLSARSRAERRFDERAVRTRDVCLWPHPSRRRSS